jgi:hypothetical protein
MDPETKTHFRKIQVLRPDYAVAVVTQYESTRTGMRVVAVDRQSPMMIGGFALATEIHDESGSPHTLEHLIFMVRAWLVRLFACFLSLTWSLLASGLQKLPVC